MGRVCKVRAGSADEVDWKVKRSELVRDLLPQIVARTLDPVRKRQPADTTSG